MTNMYETWLMEQIHSIANFPYEDIKICVLLNDDIMIVGTWGKTLLAYRVE